jgi:hypothetical protein
MPARMLCHAAGSGLRHPDRLGFSKMFGPRTTIPA